MNALDDRRENPRIETPFEAGLREASEALERRCPAHRCRAAAGEPCINSETGRPFASRFMVHLERRRPK